MYMYDNTFPKGMVYPSHLASAMATDNLAMHWASASTDTESSYSSWMIPVLSPEVHASAFSVQWPLLLTRFNSNPSMAK